MIQHNRSVSIVRSDRDLPRHHDLAVACVRKFGLDDRKVEASLPPALAVAD
jgi:hypothetical protein